MYNVNLCTGRSLRALFSFKPHHVRQHIALPTDVSRESYVCVCVCVCVLIGYSVSINCYAVWRFSAVSHDADFCVCSGKNGVSELRPRYLWYYRLFCSRSVCVCPCGMVNMIVVAFTKSCLSVSSVNVSLQEVGSNRFAWSQTHFMSLSISTSQPATVES